jgi:WD40 repeat protein
MAISHNSQYLITQQEQTLTVWDLKTANPLYQKTAQLKDGDVFSQNDSMFAVASVDPNPATVDIYNPANGKEVYGLDSQRGVRAIQFLDNSKQLIAVYDQAVDLWSMASGQQLKSTHAYDGTGCQVIRDINGQNVVSITNYHHIVTDNENKGGLCVYDPGSWRATAINEAARLIAYGDNSTLVVVNAQNTKDIQNMQGVNRRNIVSVALSPDGNLLAAVFDDHTIHIWDVDTRDEVMSLYGHNNTVTDLGFTPDGQLLISTSSDGTIRLWGVP